MIRLIVFDLWQTLAVKDVPMRSSAEIHRLVAPGMGYEDFVKVFERTVQTRRWESKVAAYTALCEAVGVAVTSELLQRVMDIRDRAEDAVRPFDFSIPLLRGLREARYLTGLLSNSTCFAIDRVREKTGLLDHVDRPVFSFDVGAIKPDPKMYEAVLGGMMPAEAVMVGDNPGDDVDPARAIGMHAIHFKGYDDLIKELEKLGVDLTHIPGRETA